MTPIRSMLLVLGLGLVWCGLDQWTKYLAVRDLTYLFPEDAGLWERIRLFYGTHDLRGIAGPPIEVIPDWWHHIYVQNPAGAFGLFSGLPDGARWLLFAGVAFLALALILWFAYTTPGPGQMPVRFAMGGVFGGAAGNLVDRVVHGYVIDFIDWRLTLENAVYQWPAFNLADVGIVVGVAGLLVLMNRVPAEAGEGQGTGADATAARSEARGDAR